MTKRTRLFLFVAAGIVVAGLGTGLVAAYKGGFQNLVLIGTNGPAEFSYVPKDARLVAYADVHAIMTSGLRQKLHPDGTQNHSPESLEERTGINFERDVDHVVASVTGPEASTDRPLVLARGRFDQVRIEGLVREQGGTTEQYKGIRILSHPERNFAVAFVEPDLVAVGTDESVRRAIDTKTSAAETVRDNADVMRLVKDVDNSSAWAVGRFDSVMNAHRLPGDIARQLPPVNWIAINGQIDDGVSGTLRAETRDEASAKDLTDVVRGFMALARLQAGQRQEFAAVINSLELSGRGNTVTLNFAIPGAAIDALSSMRQQARRDARPPAAPRQP